MKAEYISHMGTDLSAVNAARVSMDKESDWHIVGYETEYDGDSRAVYEHPILELKDKDAKLIHYLAKHKHFSCFEHQAVTLRLKVPLFVRSQIHRHRTFSYNEISRRYVKDNLEFYWPDKWRKAADNVKQGSSDEEVSLKEIAGHNLYPASNEDFIYNNLIYYNQMLQAGVCPEQARMILPQNLYTQFYMTGKMLPH